MDPEGDASAALPALPALHELESEVMTALWQGGEMPVRAVMERLNGGAAKPRAYTTYMTVMARLHGKGLLARRRQGKTDLYVPAVTREEYLQRRAASEVDELIDRYGERALSSFARAVAKLDPERRRALERLAGEDQ